MKKIYIGLTALAVAFGAPQWGNVAAQGGKNEVLITGKIVCQTCYLRDKTNTGQAMDYADLNEDEPELCGVYCARAGRPLALLMDDGKLITIVGKVREEADVRNHNGNVIGKSQYPMAQLHFGHVVHLIGTAAPTEKNGQLEFAADRLQWVLDTKDWHVGSTLETNYSGGGKVLKDGKEVEVK